MSNDSRMTPRDVVYLGVMGVLGEVGRQWVGAHRTVRNLSTTNKKFVRFRSYNGSSPSNLREVGHLLHKKKEAYHYKPGQLFLHSVFAYRGVIVCAFKCNIYTKPKLKETLGDAIPHYQYQVLVHREDWADMQYGISLIKRLAYDQTCYLTHGTTREEKVMNVINGMDLVSHDEIIPYCLGGGAEHKGGEAAATPAIEHDLFERFFKPTTKKEEARGSGTNFVPCVDQLSNQLSTQCHWLVPQAVYVEQSHEIEVRIVTFYLGINLSKGQPMHSWRYVTRLHNFGKRNVIVRERHLKIFCLNNLTNVASDSLNGHQPFLTPQMPAFQFSNHINVLQPKGGHFWGKLKAEYEDGTSFEITLPTVQLEVQTDLAMEQSGNITL